MMPALGLLPETPEIWLYVKSRPEASVATTPTVLMSTSHIKDLYTMIAPIQYSDADSTRSLVV